ncbi:MAG: amidohydrolase [Armatimonadota bacterium]|nr:amidohydrolase [Armatimonadota bacterium]MDR5696280.1 amidohydrolase [Armatimonadota bacterium]
MEQVRREEAREGTRFHNGRIYTLDRSGTVAQAVAAWGGWIVGVGSDAQIRAAFSRFRAVDLAGGVAFPGFTDSHVHFAAFGLSLRTVNLEGAASLREAVARVAQAVAAAKPGTWVWGRGWNKNVWPEGRSPRKEDLDPISPSNPVALTSKDGHLVWCNSLALTRAGVTADTGDPPGGQIERADGLPTGILKEEAKVFVSRVLPPPGDEEVESAILQALPLAHAAGITGIHDVEDSRVFGAFQRLHRDGRLSLRVVMGIPEQDADAAIRLGVRSGLGDQTLRVGFVKIFSDGTLGSQTASLLEPYEGQPDNVGIATRTQNELQVLVRRTSEAGLACAVHAIGDRANRWVLDAFEAAQPAARRFGLRQRIEHAQLLHPDDIGRFARIGVVASMQPIHCTSDRDTADRYWGRRARYAYAFRSLTDAGAVLAFGSDAPVETLDVLRGLHAAVFRRDPHDGRDPWYPQEALTVEEALRAYTNGAAYASGEEHVKGSLEEGKVCDLTVLDHDIVRDPSSLAHARVRMTVVGGQVVFSR